MPDPILTVSNLTKRFGALTACDDISLDLMPGEIHALIGPNGAGKSTLIKQLCGALFPDQGTIRFLGSDVTGLGVAERARRGLGRSFQISSVIADFTVAQNVNLALIGSEGNVMRFFDDAGGRENQASVYAARVGLGDRLGVPAAELAHGERRRLEIAMALAMRPKAFLLDEPMAGMGAEGAAMMTNLLDVLRHDAAILLVEHDMDAVFALADRITVLVGGAVIASGTPDRIRSDPQVRRAYLGEEVLP